MTPRQAQILGVLTGHVKEHGYPPSLREVCARVGLSSTASVARHLVELEAKGYIKRDGRLPRAITILNAADDPDPLCRCGHVKSTHTVFDIACGAHVGHGKSCRCQRFHPREKPAHLLAVPPIPDTEPSAPEGDTA